MISKIIFDVYKSDQLDKQATQKNIQAFSNMAEAQVVQTHYKEEMEKSVIKLTNRKKAVLSTSMRLFLDVYVRIIKINFLESDGIKKINDFPPSLLEDTRAQIAIAGEIGDAPMVTVNSVVGGLLGGFLGAVAASIADDSKRNLDVARLHMRQAEAVELQAKTIALSYQSITERVKRMTEVLTKLNVMFIKSIQYTGDIIDRNGMDRNNYTKTERKELATCINLAGAIKSILDTPIIDKNGELTKKSIEVISMAECSIQELNQVF